MALTADELAKIERRNPIGTLEASAVVKLYFASPNKQFCLKKENEDSLLKRFPELKANIWTDAGMDGGAVIRKDKGNHITIISIEVYHLQTFHRRFRCEVYYDFKVNRLSDTFISFELDECIGGLLFTNQHSANHFTKTLKKLSRKNHEPSITRMYMFKVFSNFKRADSQKSINSINKSDITLKSSAPTNRRTVTFERNSIRKKAKHSNPLQIQSDGTIDMGTASDGWKLIFFDSGFSAADLKSSNLVKNIVEVIEADEFAASFKLFNQNKPGAGNNHFREVLIDKRLLADFRSTKEAVSRRNKFDELVRSFNDFPKPAPELVPKFKKPTPPAQISVPYFDDVEESHFFDDDVDWDTVENPDEPMPIKKSGGENEESHDNLQVSASIEHTMSKNTAVTEVSEFLKKTKSIASSAPPTPPGLSGYNRRSLESENVKRIQKKQVSNISKEKIPQLLPDAEDFDEKRRRKLIQRLRKLCESFKSDPSASNSAYFVDYEELEF